MRPPEPERRRTIASANLNFGRHPGAHEADVSAMFDTAAVVLTQEDRTGKGRERIRVGKALKTDRRGSRLASVTNLGFKIGPRRIVWADVEISHELTRAFGVHMPKRGFVPLYLAYVWTLHRMLRRSPNPWIVGGDWNKRLEDDPADLADKFGASWHGQRIDGFAVHPALGKRVERVEVVDQPHRKDDHPWVFLTLKP